MKLKDLTKKTSPNTIVNLVGPNCDYLGATKASYIGHGAEYKNFADGMENQTIPCLDNRNVEQWESTNYKVIYVYLKAEKGAK